MDDVTTISDIIVGNIRTDSETYSIFEKRFAEVINVSGGIFIDWLLVHGSPYITEELQFG